MRARIFHLSSAEDLHAMSTHEHKPKPIPKELNDAFATLSGALANSGLSVRHDANLLWGYLLSYAASTCENEDQFNIAVIEIVHGITCECAAVWAACEANRASRQGTH
jgi:hypothetical protein